LDPQEVGVSPHRETTLAAMLSIATLTLAAQEQRVQVRLVAIEARVTDRRAAPRSSPSAELA
jgi:hypothetical protein